MDKLLKRFLVMMLLVGIVFIVPPRIISKPTDENCTELSDDVPFTLANSGNDMIDRFAQREFKLSPRNASRGLSMDRSIGAGMAGSGVIEDEVFPYRTALGFQALYSNPPSGPTAGTCNSAFGYRALLSNINGSYNTASGCNALFSNMDGSYNTASGYLALRINVFGGRNSAFGAGALSVMTHGSNNIAIGHYAGSALSEGHFNIFIGHSGTRDDSNTIRIGTPFFVYGEDHLGQNQTFIAGISETTLTEDMYPCVVGVTDQGQLGRFPVELLPAGPQGEPGPPGPQGIPGEGLISGSLLLLPEDIPPPPGYVLVGTSKLNMNPAGQKRIIQFVINIYQKL